jgi:multisubunit Na+/H+ antiporter MnhE subunit
MLVFVFVFFSSNWLLRTLQESPFVFFGGLICAAVAMDIMANRYSGINLSRFYGRKPADILSFW